MSNPYDEYDAIDPYDDSGRFERESLRRHAASDDRRDLESDEGDFDVIDDYPLDDGLDFSPDPAPDPLPKTMVRKRLSVPTENGGNKRQSVRGRGRRGVSPRQLRARGQVIEGRDPLESRYLDYDGRADRPVSQPRPEPVPAPVRGYGRGRVRRRKGHGCLVTLVLTVVLVAAAYWVVAHPIDERLAFTSTEQQSVNGTLSWSVPGMPYYVLALGSDGRDDVSGERSDTMILVRIDLWGGKVTMLSIPRDTMVELDGYGTQKINAAYAFEGPGGAVREVSELCGVGINHVAVVHFDELAGLVDYLGGVTVNVPEAAYDPEHSGISIEAGTQTLDGATAVAWARTRYGYARGDFQRQENQRILMEAIINRMLSLSPRQIPGALEEVGDLIGTDLRCYDLVPLFLRFKLAGPQVYSTSVPSTTDTIDGVSYVIADDAALAELMKTINAGGDPGAPVN